jgi:hypothetical protein
MSWIRPSPFHDQKEAARHMVDLLAAEGEVRGTPFSDAEREMLAGDCAISEELSSKVKYLISGIFANERQDDPDPRRFSESMAWASDGASSNIVQLTYQVADEIQPRRRLKGWARFRDMIALIGCGLLVVLMMFTVVIAAGFIFHWK